MHAIWEEIREGTGIGLIRLGPKCYRMGDPYKFTVVGNHINGQPIELKGLGCVKYTREIHDALALCLLSEGFTNYRLERYKDGIQIPQRSARIRLSSTYLKEHKMSVQVAHDAALNHWKHAVAEAGDAKLTSLTQTARSEIEALHALAPSLTSHEARLTAALPMARAFDALQAYGLSLPQDTTQQVKIGHAIQAQVAVFKHLANELSGHTGLPPIAA